MARGQGHIDAAASLREDLDETFTVLTLELPPRLRQFFVTTNYIETLIGLVRHVTRNVNGWRGELDGMRGQGAPAAHRP